MNINEHIAFVFDRNFIRNFVFKSLNKARGPIREASRLLCISYHIISLQNFVNISQNFVENLKIYVNFLQIFELFNNYCSDFIVILFSILLIFHYYCGLCAKNRWT